MPNSISRRDALRNSLAAAGAIAMISEWAMPALAQGEVDVPFTDLPANFNPGDTATTRQFDIRTINGLTVPNKKMFALQHFDRPEVNGATYKLKVTGLLNKPLELSLADLKAMKPVDVVTGYECSGNSPRAIQALSGCVKYTGVRVSDVLKRAGGPQAKAREVVFLGTDHGAADVVFRQQTFKLDQQFGRSIPVQDALGPDPLLAWNMNGEPLAREHGFPLRLVMPGYYGVCNVKWLSEIRVQNERYVGNYQARWYRTIRGVGGSGKDDGPDTQWIENEVTRLRLKSVIARVTKSGSTHTIKGFALNDGTPLKAIEISIDGGAWQKATLDPANTKFSWKLFSYKWENATPGEHTIVSRAIDIDGQVQPTAEELARKRTFLEDNGQMPRKVRV